MPDWKPEIRRRLANLQLPPTREAAIVEELAQHLDDCYAELLVGGATTDEASPDVLAFASEVLTSPVKIGGQPVVNLFASTSGTDSACRPEPW